MRENHPLSIGEEQHAAAGTWGGMAECQFQRVPGLAGAGTTVDTNRCLSPSLRVYVECAARLYGNPREADLIKIHLHSRKLTFHYYRDFDTAPLPELLIRIKIDLKRLFVTVIDHRTGPEHQLLFFKERFLAKDHPDRRKMERFSAKLRKLGLREDTIGYGPSKEMWAMWHPNKAARGGLTTP
ncbi:MAG: hypothetical protein NTW21_41390 [Verrucomicrobia bacterium]|nr:hypothetical protein [Verrucomicrobiota bacterium]